MNAFLVAAILTQAQPYGGMKCDQAQADRGIQLDLNICAYEKYARADDGLNIAWDAAAEHARVNDRSAAEREREGGFFDKLLAVQRAWLNYRDGHCEATSDRFRGGSMRPMVFSDCMRQLTETRTQQLIEYTGPMN